MNKIYEVEIRYYDSMIVNIKEIKDYKLVNLQIGNRNELLPEQSTVYIIDPSSDRNTIKSFDVKDAYDIVKNYIAKQRENKINRFLS